MKKHRNLMLKYGSMMGGVSIALTLLQHQLQAYNGAPWTIFAFGILPILFLTFFIFLGIYLSKERSFRQMIKIGLGISILFAIIAGVFWVIFIQYIDPNHLDRVNHLQLEAYQKQFPSADPQSIAEMQQDMERNKLPWIQFNLSVVSNMFFGLVISLLGSSFFKIFNRS